MGPPRSVPLEAADHWIIDRSSSASFPWSISWYLTLSAEHATTTRAVPSCESLSESLRAFLRMFTSHGARSASVSGSPLHIILGLFVCGCRSSASTNVIQEFWQGLLPMFIMQGLNEAVNANYRHNRFCLFLRNALYSWKLGRSRGFPVRL